MPVTSHGLAQISSHTSHTIITTVFLVMVSLEVLTTKAENQFMANLWPHLIQGISYSSELPLSRNESSGPENTKIPLWQLVSKEEFQQCLSSDNILVIGGPSPSVLQSLLKGTGHLDVLFPACIGTVRCALGMLIT